MIAHDYGRSAAMRNFAGIGVFQLDGRAGEAATT
jgi:hypothetical protein